jgi:hypothetical protein
MSKPNTVDTGLESQWPGTGVHSTVDTGLESQWPGTGVNGTVDTGLESQWPGTGVHSTVDTGVNGTVDTGILSYSNLTQVLLAKNIKPPVVVIDRAVPMPAMARIMYFQGTAGPLSCHKPDTIYAKEA